MKRAIIVLASLFYAHACCVTLVYNLRIAETTRRQVLEQKRARPSTVVGVLVHQYRVTKNNIKQFIAGGLLIYNHSFKNGYFRIDSAAGYIDQNRSIAREKTSRTQMDDIVCTAGIGVIQQKTFKVTLSGLFGIPTHKNTFLEGVQFGTGHVALGIQSDISWFYSEHNKNSFLGAFRFLHFFPRKPALPANFNRDITAHLGNVIDILIAHQSGSLRHKFEFGYNPSFGFGAKIEPEIVTIPFSTTFIRSNFYANYKYLFAIGKNPSGFGIGCSYGLDHKPKDIGFRRIISLWGAWGINF